MLKQVFFVLCFWHFSAVAMTVDPGSLQDQVINTAENNTASPLAMDEGALSEYRAQFLNARTATEMGAFIAKYQTRDPEELVPRAKIRLQAFTAFEAAKSDFQCENAKRQHRRISGYGISLPFSYAECRQQRASGQLGSNATSSRSNAGPASSISPRQAAKGTNKEGGSSATNSHAGVALSPEQSDNKALAEYRSQFQNAKTARELEAFIAKYESRDPEGLIRRAKIRFQAFSAFEAAVRNHQCAEAEKQHKRISGYKIDLPFSHQDCQRKQEEISQDPEALYLDAIRLEDAGEGELARAQLEKIVAHFPGHPLAVKSADWLARLNAIEAIESARKGANIPIDPNATCPATLGYLWPQMVFAELRDNPHFDEPIDGIIRKAGGLDAAIAEVEGLIRSNRRSMQQAEIALQQYRSLVQLDVRQFRCVKPSGNLCAANYFYHLLREGDFYYEELLNGLRCRKSGNMQHAQYTPAPPKHESELMPALPTQPSSSP